MSLPRVLAASSVVALSAWLVHRYGPLRRFEIAEDSMAPALRTGDYVLTRRRSAVRRGDVVVYPHPDGFFLIKRVVGLGGEEVTIREGLLLINGLPVEDPWAHRHGGPDGRWSVPTGSVFVLGDDRAVSTEDSRTVGPIPSDLLDHMLLRYWPPRFAILGSIREGSCS